jgi:hypothetical protein
VLFDVSDWAKRRLYFTELGIGTPAKSYYVDVDTGSDILWVNGISCHNCPRKSGLGVLFALTPTALRISVRGLNGDRPWWLCR